mgnify:CR=1 FL=1
MLLAVKDFFVWKLNNFICVQGVKLLNILFNYDFSRPQTLIQFVFSVYIILFTEQTIIKLVIILQLNLNVEC